MKKIALALSTLLLFAVSCKLDVKSEKLLSRPDVKTTDAGYPLISGRYDSVDTEYILVYRQEVIADVAGDPENIGIIFPKGFDKNNKTYTFEDKHFVVKDSDYQYFCRVYEGPKYGYFKTDVSNVIKATEGRSSSTDITVNVSGNFIYDSDTKVFDYSGTLACTYNDAFYGTNPKYAIALKNENDVQSFILPDSPFSITSLVPVSFLDTELQLLGVTAIIRQYQDNDPDKPLQYVYWSPLSTVTLEDPNSVTYPENKFTITTQSGDTGFDFSK